LLSAVTVVVRAHRAGAGPNDGEPAGQLGAGRWMQIASMAWVMLAMYQWQSHHVWQAVAAAIPAT